MTNIEILKKCYSLITRHSNVLNSDFGYASQFFSMENYHQGNFVRKLSQSSNIEITTKNPNGIIDIFHHEVMWYDSSISVSTCEIKLRPFLNEEDNAAYYFQLSTLQDIPVSVGEFQLITKIANHLAVDFGNEYP